MDCSSCRAANTPDARFCNQCGSRLEVVREAEHRQLTVLFADLAGSTELAAKLGPEDWRETVRRFQTAAGECVSRFEGTIAQYLGDGVLVYFGHPIAHEDDAERALRAGLALLASLEPLNDELEREFGVRIRARLATHTGPVVIGAMGGRMRTEQLALGEAPNIAARLQDLAPHGAIVTSAATLALVAGRFEIEALGVHELKGVREPMAVYRVIREAASRNRFRSGAHASLSAFVGRALELATLRAEFDAATRARGRVVWITGEPGIGKSRLVHELAVALGDTRHRWLDLQASTYAQHSAFEPFRALLDAEPGAEGDAARAHLRAPASGSSPIVAEHRRRATIHSLGDWLLALAADRPVVLAVDDLHAMDPSTVEVLERIVERAERVRFLMVVSARSGTKAPAAFRERATSLALAALAPEYVASLLEGAAIDVPLPADLRARIAERSDGNPLFAEELVRSVAARDEGDGDRAVPASLRDPLRARLDRTGAAQATAQLASALGRDFSYALLRAVSPLDDASLASQLQQLLADDLIAVKPHADGAHYQFRHALIRDAAYASMLRRTRHARHAEIARALTAGFGALVRERPDLLAHHLAAANDHAAAASQWLRAAKRASAACAFREGLSLIERGLESLAQLPASEHLSTAMALQIFRGQAYSILRGYSDADALASFQKARELAEGIDDPTGACLALLGVHGAVMLSGSTRDAADLSDELLERARESGQPWLLKSANLAAGLTAFTRGDYPRSHVHMQAALGLGGGWYAEAFLVRTTWMCGETAAALRICDEYLESVRAESALARSEVLGGVGSVQLLARDYARALVCARDSEAVARHDGMEPYSARALCLEGAARVGLGDAAAGVERIEAGYALVRGTLSESYLGWFAPFRADAHLAAGNVARALALADEGLADEAARGRRVCEAELLRVRGEAYARIPDRQRDAEVALLAAVDVARQQGAYAWEIRAVLSAARFLAERGRDAEARALLAPISASRNAGEIHPDLTAARQLLERLASASA